MIQHESARNVAYLGWPAGVGRRYGRARAQGVWCAGGWEAGRYNPRWEGN